MTYAECVPSHWIDKVGPSLRVLWRGAWGAGMIEPERYLHDHELVLVTKGACEVEIEVECHHLQAGDYLIVPPNRIHRTRCRRAVFRHCIHFDWLPRLRPAVNPVWSYAPRRPAPGVFLAAPRFVPRSIGRGHFSMDGPVPGLLSTLFHRWERGGAAGRASARGNFLELLAVLLVAPAEETETKPGAAIRLAQSAKAVLDANLAVDEGIQTALGRTGLTYAHVCRAFRSTFDITPTAYRNAARIELAKTLLRDTTLTVAEVAYKCGFQDPAYFARIFRRRNRMSPRRFRSR